LHGPSSGPEDRRGLDPTRLAFCWAEPCTSSGWESVDSLWPASCNAITAEVCRRRSDSQTGWEDGARVTVQTGLSGWEHRGSGSVDSLWPASCSAITARVGGQIHKRDGNTEQDSPHEWDRRGCFMELTPARARFAMRLRMGVASRLRVRSLTYARRG